MAREAAATVWKTHPFEGAVQCQSPGCPAYFIRTGNRHRYCKVEGVCTYKRNTHGDRELRDPEGAAQELLKRLQDDEGDVGPALLSARRKAVGDALRAGDRLDLAGTLVDEAAVCVRWADRVSRGEVPKPTTPVIPGAPVAPAHQSTTQAAGLALAAVSSHRRSVQLADHRHELLWGLLKAKEALQSAQLGVEQMAGGPQEEDARGVYDEARGLYEKAERALESAEAAWQERLHALGDLVMAANAGRPSAAAA